MALSVQTLALTSFALLALGATALLILTKVERFAAVAKDALPILLTEVVIVGSAVLAIWIGGWALLIAVLLLTFRIGFEVASVEKAASTLLNPVFVGVVLAAVSLVASFMSLTLLFWVLLPMLVLAILAQNAHVETSDTVKAMARTLAFPTVPLIFFAAAALREDHGAWLLLAFLLVETFDSYALLGGKFFGKTKAFPVLSPNKTIEGLAVGALMLTLTAIIGALIFGASVWAAIGLALLTGPLAILGDLTASKLKRINGVKDYPEVLPRQGGVFDIADAWIATGAAFVVLSLF